MKGVLIAVTAATLFALLILFGASSGWLGLSLKAEVRPIEAVTLATNLLIAFFLQRFVATKINDLRAEKNVLISEVSASIQILNELREKTSQQLLKSSITKEDRFAIIAGFRRAANAINDAQVCAEMSHLKSITKDFPGVWGDFFELKALATGRSFPSKGYTIDEQTSQDRLFRALTTNLRRLIFKINEARK
jgi:hypothetical protein